MHYDGERVELPLPHHSVAVQALRTAQFRSNSAPSLPYAAPPPGAVRHPLFASTSPRLLLRGVDAVSYTHLDVYKRQAPADRRARAAHGAGTRANALGCPVRPMTSPIALDWVCLLYTSLPRLEALLLFSWGLVGAG